MDKFYDRGLVVDVACENGQDFYLCAKSIASLGMISIDDFRCNRPSGTAFSDKIFDAPLDIFGKQNKAMIDWSIGNLDKISGAAVRAKKEEMLELGKRSQSRMWKTTKALRMLSSISEFSAIKLQQAGRPKIEYEIMGAFAASAAKRFCDVRRIRNQSEISYNFSL